MWESREEAVMVAPNECAKGYFQGASQWRSLGVQLGGNVP